MSELNRNAVAVEMAAKDARHPAKANRDVITAYMRFRLAGQPVILVDGGAYDYALVYLQVACFERRMQAHRNNPQPLDIN